MAADHSKRVDVCFVKADNTPAPGDYTKKTTKSSVPDMELQNPFERKPANDFQKIRS